jgi:small-conductance mechanosensitive channel
MANTTAIEVLGYNLEEPLPLIGISIWNIISFLVAIVIGVIIVMIIASILKKMFLRAKFDEILADFATRIIRIFMYIFVIMFSFAFLGINIGQYILGLSVVMGFVLGFAFSDTLGNLAAGFMIAATKIFKAGDFVTVNGESGTIRHVGISITELDTPDNKHIVIPNRSVWSSNIINFTRNNIRRVDLEVGVGYTDDLNKVIKTITSIVTKHPKVLSDPELQVAVKSHGDSAVNLVVRPWTKTEDYWDVFFDLEKSLKEGFDKEGISIPFPQRDLPIIERK